MSRNVLPQFPDPAVDVKSNALGPPPPVVVDVDDVVGVIVELDVDDVVGVGLEVLVVGVGLELLVVEGVGVVDELEVVAGEVLLVVVGAPGLQLLGSGLTRMTRPARTSTSTAILPVIACLAAMLSLSPFL